MRRTSEELSLRAYGQDRHDWFTFGEMKVWRAHDWPTAHIVGFIRSYYQDEITILTCDTIVRNISCNKQESKKC